MLIELIDGYGDAFSKYVGDLGCYTELTDLIRTKVDNQVRVPCLRLPPILGQWCLYVRRHGKSIRMYIDSMPTLVQMRIQFQELKKFSVIKMESSSAVA